MKKNSNYTWKLGMFVIIGMALFAITIYFIGKSQNIFGSTFHLKSNFKNVSGLNIGNNVRFSGINVGTIKEIQFVSDSLVIVDMIIRDEVRKYIKSDATAIIGSDGLMGDKVLTISPGVASTTMVKDNDVIASTNAIELEDLMKGLSKSVDNAEIITRELSEFALKINNGKGALNKVLTDDAFSKSIETTMTNLQTSSDEFAAFTKNLNDKDGTISKLMNNPFYAKSLERTLTNFEKSSNEIEAFTTKLNNGKGILSKLVTDERLAKSLDTTLIKIQSGAIKLNEIEEAAKNNFLLRGYFKKQKKAEAKKTSDKKVTTTTKTN